MRMLQEVPLILLRQTVISGFEVVMLKAKFQIFLLSDSFWEVGYIQWSQKGAKTWKAREKSFGIQVIEAHS